MDAHTSQRHSPIHKASLVDASLHSPALLELLHIKISQPVIGMLLSPGGWLYESGVLFGHGMSALSPAAVGLGLGSETALVRLAGTAMSFLVVWAFMNTSFLIWRAPREDATLRQKFGKEWEEYRKRVPWMFIPHVY